MAAGLPTPRYNPSACNLAFAFAGFATMLACHAVTSYRVLVFLRSHRMCGACEREFECPCKRIHGFAACDTGWREFAGAYPVSERAFGGGES